MIIYDTSYMGLETLLSRRGSVIPRALIWALPCGLVGAILSYSQVLTGDDGGDHSSFSALAGFVSFNAILGFLVIFRSQQAYSRYWEGLTLLQQVRGQWFNATSSLVAFCTVKPEFEERVQQFRLLQVRLTSLLYCAGLRTVATMKDDDFEVIEVGGLDEAALDFMHEHPDPCIVILQWIQQLVVSSMRSGVLDVPPPVMSRVFQELSQGIVSLADAQKIADTPFPFSSAQMIAVMMTCQWLMSPVIAASLTQSWAAAGVASFFTVFLISCLNLMASEIEIPFGDDPNDLPLGEMQDIMNVNLKTLLNSVVTTVPDFQFTDTTEQNRLVIWSKNFEPVHPDYESRKVTKVGLRVKTALPFVSSASGDPKMERIERMKSLRDGTRSQLASGSFRRAGSHGSLSASRRTNGSRHSHSAHQSPRHSQSSLDSDHPSRRKSSPSHLPVGFHTAGSSEFLFKVSEGPSELDSPVPPPGWGCSQRVELDLRQAQSGPSAMRGLRELQELGSAKLSDSWHVNGLQRELQGETDRLQKIGRAASHEKLSGSQSGTVSSTPDRPNAAEAPSSPKEVQLEICDQQGRLFPRSEDPVRDSL
mmetsp:Transcript_60784/g.144815  ORF Transcript_60784/g.144815 Transcript_60784/m.144815 type:complete len:590 (+) Transcript_60784:184-1953(+)